MNDTLPTLTGPAWRLAEAPATRDAMLTRLADEVTSAAGTAPDELIAGLVGLYREVALRQTAATWWTDHARFPLGPLVRRLFTAEDKARLAELAAKR